MATTTNYNLSAKLAADIGAWLFGGGTGWTVAGCANTAFNGEYVFAGFRYDGTTYYSPYFSDGAGHYLYRQVNGVATTNWHLSTTLGTTPTYTSSSTSAANVVGLPGTWPDSITLSALGVVAAPTRPSGWTLHLLTAQATATSKGTEVTAEDYTPQAVAAVTNTSTIDFGIPTSSWGTIVGALLQDGEDADRYCYFNVSPGTFTAPDFRVIVPIGGLMEDGIGDYNAALKALVKAWILGGTAVRPSWWVADFYGVDGSFTDFNQTAHVGYVAQPVNMVVVNATTNPGVYWNDAEVDFGTIPSDWGVCTGVQLFPMHVTFPISDNPGTGTVSDPPYKMFKNFGSPLSFIEGQDIFWPAHGLAVNTLNPPS